jgi:hypothetical protein
MFAACWNHVRFMTHNHVNVCISFGVVTISALAGLTVNMGNCGKILAAPVHGSNDFSGQGAPGDFTNFIN